MCWAKPVLVPDGIPTSLGSGIFALFSGRRLLVRGRSPGEDVPSIQDYQPEAKAVRVYEELYQLYRKVYFAFGQPAVRRWSWATFCRS